jgi:hypothetical protein
MDDLMGVITGADQAALDAGMLDGDEVWYEFHTQQDDRVRPSHAALDGSVWRVGDPDAPVPPLDYGCRCFVTYCAPPASNLRGQLPPAPDAEPVPVAELYGDALDEAVPNWRDKWRSKWSKLAPADKLNGIYLDLRDMGISDAREIASMIDTAAP